AASYAMNVFKYTDGAVIGARVVAILAIIAVIVRFVVMPLRPRLRDEQVALYLEENERSLNASVVTAVEMRAAPASAGVLRSPALIERLTRHALDRVHSANDGRAIDAGELRTNGGILAAVFATVMLLTIFGPPILRNGVKLIAVPWKSTESASPFSIAVEPGNATV